MRKRTEGSQYLLNGKTHYERNKDYYKKRARKRVQELTEFVRSIKKSSFCKDCGNQDWRVLDFDHLRDKKINIALAPRHGWSKEKILQEIEKCEIVCANCHRIRTFQRIGT